MFRLFVIFFFPCPHLHPLFLCLGIYFSMDQAELIDVLIVIPFLLPPSPLDSLG